MKNRHFVVIIDYIYICCDEIVGICPAEGDFFIPYTTGGCYLSAIDDYIVTYYTTGGCYLSAIDGHVTAILI